MLCSSYDGSRIVGNEIRLDEYYIRMLPWAHKFSFINLQELSAKTTVMGKGVFYHLLFKLDPCCAQGLMFARLVKLVLISAQ